MFSRRFGSCQVRVGFSALALLAFCCVFRRAGSLAFLGAALLHESGHLLALILLGAPPRSLELSALGCTITPGRTLPCRESVLVSLAGPAANLCAAGLCLAGGGEALAQVNLLLGLFQLLPVEPLDGGLALRTALLVRCDPERAGRVSAALSLAVLLPLAVLGFLVLLRSRGNFTLLAMSLYLIGTLLLGRELFPA